MGFAVLHIVMKISCQTRGIIYPLWIPFAVFHFLLQTLNVFPTCMYVIVVNGFIVCVYSKNHHWQQRLECLCHLQHWLVHTSVLNLSVICASSRNTLSASWPHRFQSPTEFKASQHSIPHRIQGLTESMASQNFKASTL